jgi:hypothetical protein
MWIWTAIGVLIDPSWNGEFPAQVPVADATADAVAGAGAPGAAPAPSVTIEALDRAVARLDAAAQVKRQVLEAAVACVTADRHITAAEAEVLRAVSAAMSCPMPPVLL